MSRSRIKIEIVLLNVFAMISFVCVESEVSFFQYPVLTVPYCDSQANVLVSVTNSRCDTVRKVFGFLLAYAIFVPSVSS